MPDLNPFEKAAVNLGVDILENAIPKLAQHETFRRWTVAAIENRMISRLKRSRSDPQVLPGIADDRVVLGLGILGSIERSLAENLISKTSLHTLINILKQATIDEKGPHSPITRFQNEHGLLPPSFLVISPTKVCNLHCTGCYADSGSTSEKLDWEVADWLISAARTDWGARLFVFSGGEPFAYRSNGKGILELIENHPDCAFIMYTNGTLISAKVSERLARAGNVLPAISVEGWRERTDLRRGPGIFDRILKTMEILRHDQVPFGISLTGTRQNAAEILSDDFIDFFQQQGVLYAWLFQYMPIGRSFTLDLLPTPEQRLWMWHRSWEIVRDRRMFIADFWNSGTACDGCLSAGGHDLGGYFYIDWNGAVSPCVFLPYSPVNINEVYARRGTLYEVWNDPFFQRIRQWQSDHKHQNGNIMAPCPYRDHYAELLPILREFEPDPIDENAAAALQDPHYAAGLSEYGLAYQLLTRPIWENYYAHHPPGAGGLAPLPEIPNDQSS